MANIDINIERFAHDVYKNVLETFHVIKEPDVTRKENYYTSNDFLPLISGTVVSLSLWVRDNYKIAFENKYKNSDFKDKENIWNFFDDCVIWEFVLEGEGCTIQVCMSLALCTEYWQFARTKNLPFSLDKLVIMWSDFFAKHLSENFYKEGGFLKMYSVLQTCHANKIDGFHKYFIFEFCRYYGARGIYTELEKQAKNYGFPIDVMFSDPRNIKKRLSSLFSKGSEIWPTEEIQSNLPGRDKPKAEGIGSETSDSEGSNNDTSEKIDAKNSENIVREESDSEISRNNLLGIFSRDENLRRLDSILKENIPSPPKSRLASKSPEHHPGSSDGPRSASKSPERHTGSSDGPRSASKSPKHQPGSSDGSRSASKSPERHPGSSDGPRSASYSPERQPGSSDGLWSPPEQGEFLEKVENILSQLEHGIETLNALHGLLSIVWLKGKQEITETNDKILPKGLLVNLD